MPPAPDDLLAEIATVPVWYHTLDLGEVTTPGWFDYRDAIARLPWPDVTGKRCLDVGTYDGQFAFELERRGAAEVVAIDVNDHNGWDWPWRTRVTGPAGLTAQYGERRGNGFAIAAKALGSSVQMHTLSVYDLTPERFGMFDVVTCGSLTLHLRDPMRALAAIRSVVSGAFMSAEQIDMGLTVLHRRLPTMRFDGLSPLTQWSVPNLAGFRAMITAAGFDIQRATRPYAVPFGPAHSARTAADRWQPQNLIARALAGDGVPHAAVLTTPAP